MPDMWLPFASLLSRTDYISFARCLAEGTCLCCGGHFSAEGRHDFVNTKTMSAFAAAAAPSRDITEKFITLREKAKRNRPVHVVPEEGAPALGWVAAVAKVEHAEGVITSLLEELEVAQTEHLRAAAEFGSDDETEEHPEQRVSRLTSEISKLFKSLEIALKRVVQDADNQQILMNVHRGLVHRVANLHANFRRTQSKYTKAFQGMGDREKQVSHLFENEEVRRWEEEEAKESRVDQLQEQGYSKFQIESLLTEEQIHKEKADAIAVISSSLTELSDMFSDLNALVIDHGTMLDRIDTQLEQSRFQIQMGTADIRKAHKAHKKCSVQ
eukprot:TRINITY_DN1330_c0_g1_i5.p1 TRINITY_DN1330_c0_g1~~TRINITY_DN1330_c0_g1_i5.p1  ORF type:complete len:327 (+),score=53.47 TRINITY_DN1330_c0_g1_i5:537-1517(+)